MEKLEGFSDQTRIWIYQSNRFLSPSEISAINFILDRFSKEWATHGTQLKTACFVEDPCFIVMAVDQSDMAASGCSIDSSMKVLKQIEAEYKIDLFDRLNLSYLNSNNEIEIIKMSEFQEGLNSGIFGDETIVFNNLVDNLYDFKNHWKTSVEKSWHKNLI